MFSVASIVPLLVGLANNNENLRNHYGLGIIINFVSEFIDSNNILISSGLFLSYLLFLHL